MGIQFASVDILKNGGSGGEGDALKKNIHLMFYKKHWLCTALQSDQIT